MTIPDGIEIIDFADSYAEDTVAMWRKSKEQALGLSDIHSFEDHVRFLRETLATTNDIRLAIDKSLGTVAGMIAFDDSHVNQLYISVDHQRLGIGTRLLNIAKDASDGCLRLYTFEINIGALTFYEKHGFVVIGGGTENEEGLPDLLYEWRC